MPSLAINLKHLASNRTASEAEFTSASARTRPKSRHDPSRISNLKETAVHTHESMGGALTDRTHQRLQSIERAGYPKECFINGFEFPPSRESGSGKRSISKVGTTLESVAPHGGVLNFYGTKRHVSRSIETSNERV